MRTSIRRATLVVFLLLGFGCALVVGCSSTSSSEETPSAAANAALNRAVEKLKAAQSYRFEVTATHSWMFEGQEQNWEFSGDGAFAGPNRFRSQMEGPADTFLSVEINGDDIRAWDTRGEVADALGALKLENPRDMETLTFLQSALVITEAACGLGKRFA